MPDPIARADFSRVRAVFTDVDGTLTTGHKLKSTTVSALEALSGAGVKLVLVTGRPAGWGECWARNLPVEGVIDENGALYFSRSKDGALNKVYAQRPPVRARNRKRLQREVLAAMRRVKGARLSVDS